MKSLATHLSDYELKLSPEVRETLLVLDKEYGVLYEEFETKWDMGCLNINKEFKKFMAARAKGEKYYPYIELFRDDLDEDYLKRNRELRKKFERLNCFLTKYYLEVLDEIYDQVNMTVHKGDKEAEQKYNKIMVQAVSDDDYNFAWDLIKKYPYKDMREEQPFRGADVISKMQSHIDKREFDFKAKLDPNLIPRQCVKAFDKSLCIKNSAYFSQLDVESLRIHEIDVHVARRSAGYKLGLNLMVGGLKHRNTLDEGMAITQSLHHNKYGIKPNLQWDIAIKTVIGKHIMNKDFCELFDWLIDKVKNKDNEKIIDWVLFKNLCRFKRVLRDCKKLGGNSIGETDYLVGYRMIHDKLPKSLRSDIINYNIGPEQISELPKIKRFFELNAFEPLT